jgi:hypothetical protein
MSKCHEFCASVEPLSKLNEVSFMRCPICDEHMQCGVQPWHFICYKCNYEAAALNVSINSEGNHVIFNESERQAGLAELRKKILPISLL